jgi:hypothetical protein
MAKLVRLDGGQAAFTCPGCGRAHFIRVNDRGDQTDGAWGWNLSLDAPTLTPSILTWREPGSRCHSFVRDGKIQFLSDCEHPLKNQTVDLPEWRGLWSSGEDL